MTQALHILKKNLRDLWMPLLAYYAILLIATALELRDPLVHDSTQLATIVLGVPLSVLVVAGMLIHQEPLVGTTAFWMTRPISPSSMLVSKSLFLLLFMIVPAVLTTAAIGFAYDIGPARTADAAGETLLRLGTFLAAALVAAVLTPNLPMFLTMWIGLLAVTGMLGSLMEKVAPPRYTSAYEPVETAAILLFGVLLIAHQYLTRRTRRTWALLAIASVAGILASHFWPRGFFARRTDPVYSNQKVVLSLNSGTSDGLFRAIPDHNGRLSVTAASELLEAPSGLDLDVGFWPGELRSNDGTSTRVRGASGVLDSGGIEAAMPGLRRIGPRESPPTTIEAPRVGESSLDPLVGKAATLQATVSGTLYTYRLAGSVPLSARSRFDSEELAAMVRRVLPWHNSVRVVLRARQVRRRERFPRVLLVNRRRGEMIEGNTENQSHIKTVGLFFAPFLVEANERTLLFNSGAPSGQTIDQDWLRDAELVFLDWVSAGRFQTQLEISDLRITDAPVQPGASPSAINQ